MNVTSPTSLGSAICMFWSPEQALPCLRCYVKMARCHLLRPLPAVLGISVGVPTSSLHFEERPVCGTERARASSSPRRKPLASQPRSLAKAREGAGSSAPSSALACAQQEANTGRATICTGKLGTEFLKGLNIASTTHWVGTATSPALGTAYRGRLQINRD